MSEKFALSTKNRMIKIYGGGIAIFVVIFASISALTVFIDHLK